MKLKDRLTTLIKHIKGYAQMQNAKQVKNQYNESVFKLIKSVEPQNLDLCKSNVKNYHDSGDYYQEIGSLIDECRMLIFKYYEGKSTSVVFDIDETMISEYQYMIDNDFGWPERVIDAAQYITTFPAIPAVLNFFNYCKNKNVNTFIVTSKRQKYQTYVLELLANAGYSGWTGLYLRPDEDQGTIQNYKTNTRKAIMEGGNEILINLGDQPSDVNGGYAIFPIQLPDPFYLIDDSMCYNKRSFYER